METPAQELRAFQHLLRAYAQHAGVEAAQALLQDLTERQESPPDSPLVPVLRLAMSPLVRRNWTDFSEDED